MKKGSTMLRTMLLCSLVASIYGFGQEDENDWDKKASFGGLKREKAIAFSVGNYGYVGMGVDTAEVTHKDLWQYNPTTNTWTQVASLPGSERRNAIAFSIENKGYVGTGFSHDNSEIGHKLKDLWSYDPILNSWDSLAAYPGGGDTGIYQATAFSALGKAYVACGKIGSDNYITEVWQYDPVTDEWTPRTPFPGGNRYQLVSFVVENKAYVGLGTDHDIFRKDFYEYDPVTNTWETAPELPGSERAQGSAFSIGSKGFVVFGSDGGYKDELWEFNYYTQTWTARAPFPGGGRKHAIAFSIADTGYAGLGKESDGKKQSFYAYYPILPVGIDETDNIKIDLFPNPAQDYVQIQPSEYLINYSIEIYGLNGMRVHTESYSGPVTLDVSDINKGGYLLIIRNDSNEIISTKKITIL
ncbi:MAG: kelch repeat-containing protein [Crocinitomicaceae bacterium]